MKRSILALVAVLLVVCCLTLAACDKTNGQEILDSYIFEKADSIVTEDFVLPGKIGGQDASWSSDNGAIALSQRDGDWVAQINYPEEGEVSVKLTVTVAKVSKSFTVRVKALDVYDFMSKYSFPKDKATIVDNFALDQEFSYKGKTATISWTVDENYELYIKVSEDGKTLEVTPQSVQTSVQVKARFTYNGETAVKSYRMTVYKEMEGLELVNYWYTNTGVSIDMSGYVVAIATAYSEDYGNVSLYMVNDDLTAGYYLYRVKASAANAAKLAPGVHITATGTTNTNYNGLIETNAGGNLVVDDKEPIDINNTVYAIDEEILGNLPATVYNESRLVSLTNWKVKSVAADADKAAGSNFTLLTLTKGKVDVDVRVSKYMEGAYATKAEDANWTALCNLTETATVGTTVNVTGILSKYKDSWQIMPLNAAAVTLSGQAADADDKADYTGMKVAAAVNAVNAFVKEQGLDKSIQGAKEFAFPTTNEDVTIAYEVVGSSNVIAFTDGTMTVTPGNPETTTILVTYTLGEFKTVQFLYVSSLVPSAASMLTDLAVPKQIKKTTALPTAPEGATIEWEVVDYKDSLAIVDGKLVPTLKEKTVAVTIKATLTYNNETRTKNYVVVVLAKDDRGTAEKPYTVAEIIEATSDLAENEVTSDILYLTGVVKSFEDGSYVKNLYLQDATDSTKTFLVYSVSYNDTIKTIIAGDTVVVCGYVKNYSGTIEMATNNGTFVQFVSRTVGQGTIVVGETGKATVKVDNDLKSGENGTTFTFEVTVESGYEIVAVKVNGVAVTAAEGKYTGTIAGVTTITVETQEEGAQPAQPLLTITKAGLQILDDTQSSTYNKYKGDQTFGDYTVNVVGVMPNTYNTYDVVQLQAGNGTIKVTGTFTKIKIVYVGANTYSDAYGFNITVGGQNQTIDAAAVNATKVETGITGSGNQDKGKAIYQFTVELSFESTTGEIMINNIKGAKYCTLIELY